MQWFSQNKAVIGGFLKAASLLVLALPVPHAHEIAAGLFYVGGLLLGSGLVSSDAEVKARS